MKEIVIIGGPNGAGKTTAAQLLVPKALNIGAFVNADEIARGLSPFDPERMAVAAGRLMISRMRDLIRDEESFAFETTCSGRSHLSLLRECKAACWRVTLLFLWLPSPQLALDRVARRVQTGGHFVAPAIIIRRYWAGLANMRELYLPMADLAAIYDNSDTRRRLIAERTVNGTLQIHEPESWTAIQGGRP